VLAALTSAVRAARRARLRLRSVSYFSQRRGICSRSSRPHRRVEPWKWNADFIVACDSLLHALSCDSSSHVVAVNCPPWKKSLKNYGHSAPCLGLFLIARLVLVFTAQCTLVHMRGLGIACRPSVRLSVRLSVTLVDCDHISWKSWKLTARTISPTPSLFVAKRRSTYSQGNMGKFGGD